MTIPIKIYIGFDPRETIAFHVLAHSIHVRSSLPVSITPLMLDQLRQALRPNGGVAEQAGEALRQYSADRRGADVAPSFADRS